MDKKVSVPDHEINAIVNRVLKELGVDPTVPPFWKTSIHNSIDQTTGEVVRQHKNGYLCSYCGKHSWTKKEKCDGCNSIMHMEL